jgi:hypothetical protein
LYGDKNRTVVRKSIISDIFAGKVRIEPHNELHLGRLQPKKFGE